MKMQVTAAEAERLEAKRREEAEALAKKMLEEKRLAAELDRIIARERPGPRRYLLELQKELIVYRGAPTLAFDGIPGPATAAAYLMVVRTNGWEHYGCFGLEKAVAQLEPWFRRLYEAMEVHDTTCIRSRLPIGECSCKKAEPPTSKKADDDAHGDRR